MMSVFDAIASLATPGPYTVRRSTAGTNVRGRNVPGAETTLVVTGCLQPTDGRDLSWLPEGQNGNEIKVLWCQSELVTREPGHAPDVVVIAGEDYYVIRVKHWEAFGDEAWEAYMSRTVIP